MSLALDVASWVLLVAGSVFCVIGGLGLLRLPDLYARVHAAGITDTAGAGLLLAGLALQSGLSQVSLKLALVIVFLYLTSPTATHALLKAAAGRGYRADLPIEPLGASGPPSSDPEAAGSVSQNSADSREED